MKMMLGNTPIKSLNIHHFEMDTNSATVQPSDLQAGITCFARGQKVTGTGRCFEFANYGGLETNNSTYIPTGINVIEIASTQHPIKHYMTLTTMSEQDFSVPQTIGAVVISDVEYPITVQVTSNILNISCDQTVALQIFYAKDRYV